jgi:hypothetical protein
MIEYLIALSLILIITGMSVLVKGGFEWSAYRKKTGESLHSISTLLDELLDMINEYAADAPSQVMAQTGGDMKDMLASMFIQRFVNKEPYGEKEKRQISEEENDTAQTQTEV